MRSGTALVLAIVTRNLVILSSVFGVASSFTRGRPSLLTPCSIPGSRPSSVPPVRSKATDTDLTSVRQALADLVDEKNCGPILIRLAWHDAGTFCAKDGTGGPRGCMRFKEGDKGEGSFDANNGLDVARQLVQPIKESLAPDMSYADFWALAAIVATKQMGGPEIKFRSGRKDASNVDESVEEGRHPDGDKGSDHLRDVFYRMGLTDQDIVVLSGAHTVGKCHVERSGFEGPWTKDPYKFDNSYFVDLLNKEWIPSESSVGKPQFRDGKAGEHMMLISDMALVEDEQFRPYVERYAKDQDAFFEDYAVAFQKLIELGVKELRD